MKTTKRLILALALASLPAAAMAATAGGGGMPYSTGYPPSANPCAARSPAS